MKIVSAQEMARIEALAYHTGASEISFMEEAGKGIAQEVQHFVQKHRLDKLVTVFCGKGNNAGDAYVAARHLRHQGFAVTVLQLVPLSTCSPLCRQNYMQFITENGSVFEITSPEQIQISSSGIVLDGIFGTGFRGAATGIIATAIEAANRSGLPILSIDIPSGLEGDTGAVEGPVINATKTLYLGLPKTGFFLRDGWCYVGELTHVDFGLSNDFLEQANADFHLVTDEMTKSLLPTIKRNRHKYEAGAVVGLAGSYNMPGAALLSSLAALRGGAGVARILHPKGIENVLANSPYEVIKVPYDNASAAEQILETMNNATATYFGPGLGLNEQIHRLLSTVLAKLKKPCVIDADALSLFASQEFPLPTHTVMTPHTGEMHRLLHLDTKQPLTMAFLQQVSAYANKHKVTLILKGGPSFIFKAGEPIYVSSRGDGGMATAGSGDVLTGLIAALLAQDLKPLDAALLGVVLHGIAGEAAAKKKTSYCMIASDIIDHFVDAFTSVLATR